MAEKRKDKDGRILPENVTQRKDGTYMWRKSINGKSYCLYAKTLGEIKQKRNIALGEIEKGTYKGKHEKMEQEREGTKKDITLNEWFFQWEKSYRDGRIRMGTLYYEHYAYMSFFSDNIGKMKIKDIKQIDIVNIFNEASKAGRKRSYLKRVNLVLTMLFESACKNGMIENNPARGALQVPKDKKVEKRVLTEQEEEQFFKYISNSRWYERYVPLFTVGFGTGMRIGEILALTWKDVDFENNVIHVNKTLVHLKNFTNITNHEVPHFIINEPKTPTSIREVPMLGKVKEALLKQKKICPKCKVTVSGYTDFIFLTRTGNVFESCHINEMMKTIVDNINMEETEMAEKEGRQPINFERFSCHSMRHTFATRCYEKGMREKVIQKILGHSKLDMTLNVYTHVTDEMIGEDIRKLERPRDNTEE